MPRLDAQLVSIGHVRISEGLTQLALDRSFAPALGGLADFSHLIVLYWCHLTAAETQRQALVHAKPYVQGPREIGVFATRSPARPNPIAMSAVRITGIDLEAATIAVPYVDAEDGTPILDIKPYHPSLDRIREVEMPAWCRHWPAWHEDSASFDWGAEFNFD